MRARITSCCAGPSGAPIASPWGACTATRSSATTSRWSRCAPRCRAPAARLLRGGRTGGGRRRRGGSGRSAIRGESVRAPLLVADGVLLSGEMHEQEAFEPIPDNLRVERAGAVVPDTFLGEQTLIANLKGRGLVVVTSCSHRGILAIRRHAARITGVPKVHAVIGGFRLSGLREERVTRVVDAFRDLEVDWIVPQHCTGLEAMASMMHRLPNEMVPSSVGSVFTFGK